MFNSLLQCVFKLFKCKKLQEEPSYSPSQWLFWIVAVRHLLLLGYCSIKWRNPSWLNLQKKWPVPKKHFFWGMTHFQLSKVEPCVRCTNTSLHSCYYPSNYRAAHSKAKGKPDLWRILMVSNSFVPVLIFLLSQIPTHLIELVCPVPETKSCPTHTPSTPTHTPSEWFKTHHEKQGMWLEAFSFLRKALFNFSSWLNSP